MEMTTVLCILLLTLYILLALFWLTHSIIDMVKDRKREKKNAAWDEEKQKLEKERALLEIEYQQSRIDNLKK